MRLYEFQNINTQESVLSEAASPVLFHYTNLGSAVDITHNGAYSLESSTGKGIEPELGPKFKPWFLATTRTKVGDYTMQQTGGMPSKIKTLGGSGTDRDAIQGIGGVVFNLDGNWLNKRYETKAVDYWGPITPGRISKLKRGEWKNIKPEDRRASWSPRAGVEGYRDSEAEDRVFSKDSEIPLQGSTLSIHLWLNTSKKEDDSNWPYHTSKARAIIDNAHSRNIPLYFYTNRRNWMLQNPRYRLDPRSPQVQQLLDVPPPEPRSYEPYRSDYWANLEWVKELIEKQPTQELSPSASKLLFNFRYYSYDLGSLKAAFHNASTPDRDDYEFLRVVNNYMARNKLSTVEDLGKKLVTKWQSYTT